METFSSVQMRLANSFSEELQKIYRINQRYLPLVQYYVVNNTPQAITRADYAEDMLVQPIFDPKFATQSQKVSRAQAELQATLQNPNNQGRPQVIDEAFRRYLEALDVDNIEALIPPPPEPMNVDNQEWENMQFMLPQGPEAPFDVFPDQDHAKHLQSLHDFVRDKGGTLSPEQAMNVAIHKQKHEAYQYGVEKGIIPPKQQARQIGASSLAQSPGNGMGNGQANGAIPFPPAFGAPQILGAGILGGGASAGI
jgi:hypothetical protein